MEKPSKMAKKMPFDVGCRAGMDDKSGVHVHKGPRLLANLACLVHPEQCGVARLVSVRFTLT